jgi:hypothetical protein
MWESDDDDAGQFELDHENLPVEDVLQYFRYQHGRRFVRNVSQLLIVLDGIEELITFYPLSNPLPSNAA